MSKGNKAVISTVLLNWNRKYLLEQTVNSYLETVDVPYELIIIDNGSKDGSQEFIKEICANNNCCKSILLEKNMGGFALNKGLARAEAELLHVSANDLQYKAGWVNRVIKVFEVFPELGQLSLYSFSPDRNKGDISEEKPSKELTRQGFSIYKTEINVGTSSVFRREIWDKGVRWKNIGNKAVKLPNDYIFSKEVMEAGYIVAWNDHYLVTNFGHLIDEIKNNFDYYLRDYMAKHRGMQKFQTRIKRFGYKLEKDKNTEYGYRMVSID